MFGCSGMGEGIEMPTEAVSCIEVSYIEVSYLFCRDMLREVIRDERERGSTQDVEDNLKVRWDGDPSYRSLVWIHRAPPPCTTIVHHHRAPPSYRSIAQIHRADPSYSIIVQTPRIDPSYRCIVLGRLGCHGLGTLR